MGFNATKVLVRVCHFSYFIKSINLFIYWNYYKIPCVVTNYIKMLGKRDLKMSEYDLYSKSIYY